MGTRAVFTFIDKEESHHVYKHSCGSPSDAIRYIKKTLRLAWALPRFEADEFAAAFIAANKKMAGDIRLTRNYDKHPDLDYRYEIYVMDYQLCMKIFERDWKIKEAIKTCKFDLIFQGFLDDSPYSSVNKPK